MANDLQEVFQFVSGASFLENKWTLTYFEVVFQVWRFFITFSDVLELWPFTLDEFVQALHDYVSHPWGHFLPNKLFSSLLLNHSDTLLNFNSRIQDY